MQKQKLIVMFPNAVFVESDPVPPGHQNEYVDVSGPAFTGMHYMTRRSHRMQKLKFSVMCPSALFVESVQVPPEEEK
jgi:hypothetical protein